MQVSIASLLDSQTGILDILDKCLHVGVLKWISYSKCLILIFKTHTTRAYVFRFESHKKSN